MLHCWKTSPQLCKEDVREDILNNELNVLLPEIHRSHTVTLQV